MQLYSEKAEQDREGKQYEPDNMGQEECLTGEQSASSTDVTETSLGNTRAGAQGIGAAAPVGHPVHPTNGVGPEAFDGASGASHRTRAEIIAPAGVVTLAW